MLKTVNHFGNSLNLPVMKKRAILYAWSLILSLGFATVFQSVHEVSHGIISQAELCHHKYGSSNHEITHQHHNYDNCKVCAFSFTQVAWFDLNFQTVFIKNNCDKSAVKLLTEVVSTRLPSKFLRGPPQIVV